MIRITENTKKRAIFIKNSRNDRWFKDCSDKALLKELGREGDVVKKVQFEDGEHIASILFVYF